MNFDEILTYNVLTQRIFFTDNYTKKFNLAWL